MTDADWEIALDVFRGCLPRRGDKGRDDRRFLEALHYFTVQNVSWRALPAEYGHWNTVWKRFSRLSRSGVFEAFFQVLADLSPTAHLVQMFDSTTVRAHVSAAGAKGGSKARRSDVRAVASRPRSTSRPTSTVSEQFVGKLKRFKRIALRCEKTAENFASLVSFACSLILVKSVHRI